MDIKNLNKDSMSTADSFANAVLLNGTEKIGAWFDSFNNITFAQPFFRTTTGKDTYFVIDSELLDRKMSRDKALEIILNFWCAWKDENPDKDFFWKVSGVGIHALQRAREQVNPLRFRNVFHELFPKKDGWNQVKDYLVKKVPYSGQVYKIGIDLQMCEYPKLIRWVFSPYWKIPHQQYFSIPIYSWDIDEVLKESTNPDSTLKAYKIPAFQFSDLLGPGYFSTIPGFKGRFWKTDYLLNIPDLDKPLPAKCQKSMEKIKKILENAPNNIKKAVDIIKTEDKNHIQRITILKYLQKNKVSLPNIATFFRFYLNSESNNKEPWKVHYYCSYYFNKKNVIKEL